MSRLIPLLQLAHVVIWLFMSSYIFIWWDIVGKILVWKNEINLSGKVGFMRAVSLYAQTVFQGW